MGLVLTLVKQTEKGCTGRSIASFTLDMEIFIPGDSQIYL